jgi:ribosomal protein S18 acetylase RimI-like enzyme
MDMEIIEIKNYQPELLEAINRMLPQLSPTASMLSESALKQIVESSSSHLLMAAVNNKYHGSLTLVVYKIPTGSRAWIEDVVVCSKARGKGLGRKLIESALDLAKQLGAETVNLTSRASRETANELYKKLGFEKRETNAYRYRVR